MKCDGCTRGLPTRPCAVTGAPVHRDKDHSFTCTDDEQSVANRIADWLDANGYLAPTQLIREGRWRDGR